MIIHNSFDRLFFFFKKKSPRVFGDGIMIFLSSRILVLAVVEENFVVDENLATVGAGLLSENFKQLAVGVDHPAAASVKGKRWGERVLAVMLVSIVSKHRQSHFDLSFRAELCHWKTPFGE